MKTEVEEAMKLFEKDISEKEHIMTDIQKQLDDIKAVNVSFCSKLQVGSVNVSSSSSFDRYFCLIRWK